MFYRLLRHLQQWKHFNWNKDISMTTMEDLEAIAEDFIENTLTEKMLQSDCQIFCLKDFRVTSKHSKTDHDDLVSCS